MRILTLFLTWLMFFGDCEAAISDNRPQIRRLDRQIRAAIKAGQWHKVRRLRDRRKKLVRKPPPSPTPTPITPTPTPTALIAPWYVPSKWRWPDAVIPEMHDPLVLVCAGQSNMAGAEQSIATIPPALSGIMHDVYIWQPNGWAQYSPGINFPTWGPEAEFARKFRADNADRTLLIVKYAVGGTQLAAGSRIDWSPVSRGELFDFMERIRSNSIVAEAETIMLWLQGESDGFDRAMARAYEGNLRQFIAEARVRWNLSGAIIILGEIHRGTAFPIPHAATVRLAQERVASELGLPVVDTAAFPLTSRRMHFTAAGQVMLGGVFYDAYANN